MRPHLIAAGAVLLLGLGGPAWVTIAPAWSQSPGLTDGVQAPAVQPPTTVRQGGGEARWNLSDLLWGLTRLQSSPRKLTAAQKAKILPALDRVLAGGGLLKDFDSKARAILTTDQAAYIKHLAVKGALAEDPPGLPPGPPGEDPLVHYVIQLLEKKAK